MTVIAEASVDSQTDNIQALPFTSWIPRSEVIPINTYGMGVRSVCFVFLLTVFVGNALKEQWSITQNGDGYSGILVVIGDRVPESQGDDIIDKMKVNIMTVFKITDTVQTITIYFWSLL